MRSAPESKALRVPEEKLYGLLKDAPVGVVLCEMDGTFVEVNPAYEQLTGYSAEELRELTYWDITQGSYNHEAEHSSQAFTRDGRFGPFENEYLRKDGSTISVLLHSAQVTLADGHRYILATVDDLTERVETERLLKLKVAERTAELERSEARFRTFSDATFEGIVITREGVIQEGNRQFSEMFGYRPEELEGMKAIDFVAPKMVDTVRQNIESQAEHRYESIGLRKDGITFPMEVQARSIPSTEGLLRITAVRDITERKLMDEQLRQSQKLQAIGQLTTGIAHNFNNRLMSILGSLELMEREQSYVPEIAEIGEKAALRAAEMIKQLMAFSRMSNVSKSPVEVAPLLHGVCSLVREALTPKIILTQNVSDGLPTILGNPNQLEQVFLNLLLNARDALEEKQSDMASIELRATGLTHAFAPPPDLFGVPAQTETSYLCIQVVDNGIGMEEETRERVFDPFFTTKDVNQGTGLGLATVYGIVEEHNGRISCESRLGEGTTFTVFLPAEEQRG
jgi:two-component system cell cycle sensor histidine kinase/response regulator CckA